MITFVVGRHTWKKCKLADTDLGEEGQRIWKRLSGVIAKSEEVNEALWNKHRVLQLLKNAYGTMVVQLNAPGTDQPTMVTAEFYKDYKLKEGDKFAINPKLMTVWNNK